MKIHGRTLEFLDPGMKALIGIVEDDRAGEPQNIEELLPGISKAAQMAIDYFEMTDGTDAVALVLLQEKGKPWFYIQAKGKNGKGGEAIFFDSGPKVATGVEVPAKPLTPQAYIVGIIDTDKGVFMGASIFSEERPTLGGNRFPFTIATGMGHDYESGLADLDHQWRGNPWIQWVRPFLSLRGSHKAPPPYEVPPQ